MAPDTPRPTLLAVDGNSLTHRAYHALAGTRLRDRTGRPTWAVKGFFNLLLGAVDRVSPDALVIGFDDHTDSRRKTAHPAYKAQRGEKDDELRSQLALIPQVARAAGLHVVTPPSLEADDVTAAAARAAGAAGWRCVIVTSDRDAFAHISDHTAVLRVINGGIDNSPILTPPRLATMIGISPCHYLDYAAMRGDTSDNLPGIRGIGEKTAAKLLSGFATVEDLWADVDADGKSVVACAGKAALTKLRAAGARDAWARNRRLMAAATDFSLDLDLAGRTGPGHLPVAADALVDALRDVDLASVLGPAARLLAHTSPQPPTVPVLPLQEPLPYDELPPDDDAYPPAVAAVTVAGLVGSPKPVPAAGRTGHPTGGLHPAATLELF